MNDFTNTEWADKIKDYMDSGCFFGGEDLDGDGFPG
jgi:hypothetical protein